MDDEKMKDNQFSNPTPAQEKELSEDQLEKVSGGAPVPLSERPGTGGKGGLNKVTNPAEKLPFEQNKL